MGAWLSRFRWKKEPVTTTKAPGDDNENVGQKEYSYDTYEPEPAKVEPEVSEQKQSPSPQEVSQPAASEPADKSHDTTEEISPPTETVHPVTPESSEGVPPEQVDTEEKTTESITEGEPEQSVSSEQTQEQVTVKEEPPVTPDVEEAVVKIQAGIRGYLTRKEIKQKKDEIKGSKQKDEESKPESPVQESAELPKATAPEESILSPPPPEQVTTPTPASETTETQVDDKKCEEATPPAPAPTPVETSQEESAEESVVSEKVNDLSAEPAAQPQITSSQEAPTSQVESESQPAASSPEPEVKDNSVSETLSEPEVKPTQVDSELQAEAKETVVSETTSETDSKPLEESQPQSAPTTQEPELSKEESEQPASPTPQTPTPAVTVNIEPPTPETVSYDDGQQFNVSSGVESTSPSTEDTAAPKVPKQEETEKSEAAEVSEEKQTESGEKPSTEGSPATEEPEPCPPSPVGGEEQAAVKIQAVYRGYRTRKQLSESPTVESPAKGDEHPLSTENIAETQKEHANAEETLSEITDPITTTEQTEDVTVENTDSSTPQGDIPEKEPGSADSDVAAVKIQAAFRGYKVRKDMKSRESSPAAAATSESPVPDEEKELSRPSSGTSEKEKQVAETIPTEANESGDISKVGEIQQIQANGEIGDVESSKDQEGSGDKSDDLAKDSEKVDKIDAESLGSAKSSRVSSAQGEPERVEIENADKQI